MNKLLSLPALFIVAGILSHAATDLLPFASAAVKPWLEHGIDLLALLATWKSALAINPDNTPATVAYVPPVPK